VFTKQKLAADFVITVPYEGKSQNKTCCAFCESGSLEPIPQSMQRVLCGSGFAQNVHEKIQNTSITWRIVEPSAHDNDSVVLVRIDKWILSGIVLACVLWLQATTIKSDHYGPRPKC
jgi:hypothetical protein